MLPTGKSAAFARAVIEKPSMPSFLMIFSAACTMLANSARLCSCFFFFQAEDGIRDHCVTGVQTCALPISIAESLDGRAYSLRIKKPAQQGSNAMMGISLTRKGALFFTAALLSAPLIGQGADRKSVV